MASEPSSEKQRHQRTKRQRNRGLGTGEQGLISGFVDSLREPLREWLQKLGISFKVSALRLLLFCVVLVSLFLAMTPSSLLIPVPFVVGQTFPHDIRAYRSVRYLSEIETERRRQTIAQAVPRQYRLDTSVALRWRAVLNDLIDSVISMKQRAMPIREKVKTIKQRIGLDVPDQVLVTLMNTSPSTVRFGYEMLLRNLELEWQRGIKPISEEQLSAVQRVKGNIDKLPLGNELKSALKHLAELALQPNMVFDPIATQRAREKAKASVEPVWMTITAGELIARRGELVTEEHLEKLKALGYNFSALLGIAMLSLITTAFTVLFLRLSMPSTFSDNHRLTLLVLLWSFGLILVRFLYRSLGSEISFVVTATVAMMTTVLFAPIFSIYSSGVFALATTLGMSMDWQTLPTGALTPFLSSAALGAASSFLSADAKTRMQLVHAGVLLSILAFFLPLMLGLVTGETLTISWEDFQRLLLWALLTGAIPPALTLAGVSALERPFNITTVFTLTELANPNAPLLRELAEKAPGTFQSSLMVARLAQEAARRIGANDLLAWVGGLYHDIGKLQRPQYFVENQPPGARNPHDNLAPDISANVLVLHVEQGVEIARKNRLPSPIIDIIREHHGTSVMTYFLDKAKKRTDLLEEDREENKYRYKGPKPRSKESAIVMLADSVEAAVRALPNSDLKAIEQVVEEVIAGKLEDGQLEESPLNFRDLTEIKRAFLDTFKSIYHQRIEYPKKESDSNGSQRPYIGAKNHQPANSQRVEGQTEASS
ncbi:MAG: HDIG domain-containing protein [Armatimonadetes bacterium]|nr:HDIG domain-containing protein [Armatimonadota bacterium]MCX7969571.1 HDIG domain-containing protein [Armatimonadota bacterium]MDW8142815.1 HDIG domain-containing protein [Armatimonadota bacterium]